MGPLVNTLRMLARIWWLKLPILVLVLACIGIGSARGTGPAAEALTRCQDQTVASSARLAACTHAIETAASDEVRGEAFLQRGVLQELAGAAAEAVKDYTQAIKLDAGNALAYFNRGNAHDALRAFDLAIADYTEAIRLNPEEPDFFNNRGQSRDSVGDHDRAIADYSQAIRLSPKSAQAFYNRGLSYANKGDYRGAITDFDRAIAVEPDASLHVARGAANEELGNTPEARADYRRALALEPLNEDALEGLNRLGN